MGTFIFTWEHPAQEVFVTGTFDNWTKSAKLDKIDGIFQKKIELKDISQKIYYKFFVDNQWSLNETAPSEQDGHNNVNNVLTPDQISKHKPDMTAISSVDSTSTTAMLAGSVPLEGADKAVSVASSVPGGFPITPSLDPDQTISVSPLPAAAGALNPIKLEPGQPVPNMSTSEALNQYVRLDKESYERSDALPGVGSGPLSSLLLSSAAPTATTVRLAGEAPLVVQQSQQAAGIDPNEIVHPTEVKEKAVVEQELLTKVPEAPSTAEGVSGEGTIKMENHGAAGLGAIGSVGTTLLASAMSAKNAAAEKTRPLVSQATEAATLVAAGLPESVKAVLPAQVQPTIAQHTKEQTLEQISPQVPTEVKQSIIEADVPAEATTNTQVVETKKAMEAELLSEVKPTAPIVTTATESARSESTMPVATVQTLKTAPKEPTPEPISPQVPTEVKQSIIEADVPAEATTNTQAVETKKAMEAELLSEVKPTAPIVTTATESARSESTMPVATVQTLKTAPKEPTPEPISSQVPTEVRQSIIEADVPAEATTNTLAVETKKAVEAELLSEVKPTAPIASAVEEPASSELTTPAAGVQTAPAASLTPMEAVVEPEPALAPTAARTTTTMTTAGTIPPPAVSVTADSADKSSVTGPDGPSSSRGLADSPASSAKKRHRLSSIFNKLKHKVHLEKS